MPFIQISDDDNAKTSELFEEASDFIENGKKRVEKEKRRKSREEEM